MHQIEAVSVCIGYADILAEVAPLNRPLLHRWLVVTSPEDKATQRVCRAASIECLVTDDARRDGEFSKGRLIDRGLAMLGGYGWMLHLDADIALPIDLHQVLDDAHLDERNIYGCDRLNVVGAAAWDRMRGGLWCRHSAPWAVHLARRDTSIGTRVANPRHGYTPIGFWQLWHGSTGRQYPIHHGTAARTDVQHALQWDRQRRVHIPELVVWHLESEPARMGANWRGRKTKLFRGGDDGRSTVDAGDIGSGCRSGDGGRVSYGPG